MNKNSLPAVAESSLSPQELREDGQYLVRTLFSEVEAAVSGPWADSDAVEFYIVEAEDGGFDLEWRGDHWDAGDLIGHVHVSAVSASV
jgi:hypothetical protein